MSTVELGETVIETEDFAVLQRVIQGRRTNLRIDRNRPLPSSVVSQLIELSTWAPNHHLTQPWAFAVVTGESLATIGQCTAAFQAEMGMTDEAKLAKTSTKYLRAPAVVMVASISSMDASSVVVAEDRDAVASAIQNLLLAATALGLATYWGTGAVCEAPSVKAMCDFPEHAVILAAIYVGWPIGEVPTPTRRPPSITWRS